MPLKSVTKTDALYVMMTSLKLFWMPMPKHPSCCEWSVKDRKHGVFLTKERLVLTRLIHSLQRPTTLRLSQYRPELKILHLNAQDNGLNYYSIAGSVFVKLIES